MDMSEMREEKAEKEALPTDEEILGAVRRFWAGLNTEEGWLDTDFPTRDPLLTDRFTEDQIEDKMEEMSDRGLLEYGISVRTARIPEDPEQPVGMTANTMRIISKVLGDKHQDDRPGIV